MKKQPQLIHQVLIKTTSKPLYKYSKDGIICLFGNLYGENLTLMSQGELRDGLLEYLEDFVYSDMDYKSRYLTIEVLEELKSLV